MARILDIRNEEDRKEKEIQDEADSLVESYFTLTLLSSVNHPINKPGAWIKANRHRYKYLEYLTADRLENSTKRFFSFVKQCKVKYLDQSEENLRKLKERFDREVLNK